MSNTLVAARAIPVLISALAKHLLDNKSLDSVAQRECLSYHESFAVVKGVLEDAMDYTIEEIQWVKADKVFVPSESLALSARILHEYFGEDELDRVIGGKTWWQRRLTPDGAVPAEWIEVPGTNDGGRTMLYIHGGAGFFGSINTHRYTLWRYARKIRGRVFAARYRLAPQYPFPCQIQDALAAYLYLIRPPPGAAHKAVPPNQIIIAGDSFGGGLSLALLCVIRDLGMPAPACAVLISPWVDLTHSFPSILQNTATDIIPPYSFITRPSSSSDDPSSPADLAALWPPPPDEFRAKADETATPAIARREKRRRERTQASSTDASTRSDKLDANGSRVDSSIPLTASAEDLGGRATEQPSEGSDARRLSTGSQRDPDDRKAKDEAEKGGQNPAQADFEAKESGPNAKTGGNSVEPDGIIRLKIDGKDVEVKDQIQLYATNAQLIHPIVSPVLQPSLGGLPPLYILCGDSEVLRDEILYLAHRAARPLAYPLRKELLEANGDRARLAKKFDEQPTKVHLQCFDGACHVLPLFSFTRPATYCFRAIASFCIANTTPSHLVNGNGVSTPVPQTADSQALDGLVNRPDVDENPGKAKLPLDFGLRWRDRARESRSVSSPTTPASSTTSIASSPIDRPLSKSRLRELVETVYSAERPFHRPSFKDSMIRERVSTYGVVRPLEPETELQALKLSPDEIGVIKEGPVARYLEGKRIADKRYRKVAKKVERERTRQIERARKVEGKREKRLLGRMSQERRDQLTRLDEEAELSDDEDDADPDVLAFRGPWDLRAEHPPPSSIAARKDTAEAVKLARVIDEEPRNRKGLMLWSALQDLPWQRRDHEDDDDDASALSDDETRARNEAAHKAEKQKG